MYSIETQQSDLSISITGGFKNIVLFLSHEQTRRMRWQSVTHGKLEKAARRRRKGPRGACNIRTGMSVMPHLHRAHNLCFGSSKSRVAGAYDFTDSSLWSSRTGTLEETKSMVMPNSQALLPSLACLTHQSSADFTMDGLTFALRRSPRYSVGTASYYCRAGA